MSELAKWSFRQHKRVAHAQWFGNALHAIFVSLHFDRALPMTATNRDHVIAALQQLSALYITHSSPVCRIIAIDRTEKIHLHHTAAMDVNLVSERLGQRLAVCLVDVA